MNLTDLWKKRARVHQKKLFKYSKYVFNDHFVLVLLFMMGGGGYWYSEYVKTVTPDQVLPRVVIWLVLAASLLIGRFATLVQPADKVFLLPLERHFHGIMERMKWRSFVFPAMVLLLVSAAVMPLLAALGVAPFSQWLLVAAMLLLLKECELDWQLVSFTLRDPAKKRMYSLVLYGAFLLVLFLAVFVSVWIGAIGALSINVLSKHLFRQLSPSARWQWEEMVQMERNRLQRIYRFINLFTEIPSLSDRPKRRKWADVFMERLPSQKQSPFLYLYLRAFVRGTSYSGLVLRLTVLGAAISWFSHQFEFSLLVGLVFLYLIGFQLIPLYHHFDDSLLVKLYPLSSQGKVPALQKLLLVLLLSTSFVFWLAGLFSLGMVESLFLLLAYSLFSCLFVWGYVPYRLKKKTAR